ncbi:MAG: hypothetical protein E7597_04670 [Ruminococcaceae bacterium]|nr:hypothetical protein [Oscillospiraceae bacterium]
MLNVDEARSIIQNKMRRFLDWSVYAISEDDENYYFFYGANDTNHPDYDMPVFAVCKSNGKVSQLIVSEKANFKILYEARVFYNRGLGIDLSVEERAAIRRKFNFPDAVVTCPRCGSNIQWIKQGTSVYVQCEKLYCIYCSIRTW